MKRKMASVGNLASGSGLSRKRGGRKGASHFSPPFAEHAASQDSVGNAVTSVCSWILRMRDAMGLLVGSAPPATSTGCPFSGQGVIFDPPYVPRSYVCQTVGAYWLGH